MDGSVPTYEWVEEGLEYTGAEQIYIGSKNKEVPVL